jgi:hypothetical protein
MRLAVPSTLTLRARRGQISEEMPVAEIDGMMKAR